MGDLGGGCGGEALSLASCRIADTAWGVPSCSDVWVGSGGGSVGWGWRSMRVAAAAGPPHPPLSDRRESLLDSLKNKSHK